VPAFEGSWFESGVGGEAPLTDRELNLGGGGVHGEGSGR